MLIDWLRSVGRDFAVVATKADRLSGNERVRNLAALKKDLQIDSLLAVSSKTGYGLNPHRHGNLARLHARSHPLRDRLCRSC